MAQASKRKRSADFSAEEVKVIVNGFVEHNEVLSAKHSSTVTNTLKKGIYETITAKVNAVGGNAREVESVKDKWHALKKGVKAKFAKESASQKKTMRRTGGGPLPNESRVKIEEDFEEWERAVLSVIPPELLEGMFSHFFHRRVLFQSTAFLSEWAYNYDKNMCISTIVRLMSFVGSIIDYIYITYSVCKPIYFIRLCQRLFHPLIYF